MADHLLGQTNRNSLQFECIFERQLVTDIGYACNLASAPSLRVSQACVVFLIFLVIGKFLGFKQSCQTLVYSQLCFVGRIGRFEYHLQALLYIHDFEHAIFWFRLGNEPQSGWIGLGRFTRVN